MQVVVGMIIDLQPLDQNQVKVEINQDDNDVLNFIVDKSEITKIKQGQYVVVYCMENNNKFKLKLLDELI